jgi:hypothetical protein
MSLVFSKDAFKFIPTCPIPWCKPPPIAYAKEVAFAAALLMSLKSVWMCR